MVMHSLRVSLALLLLAVAGGRAQADDTCNGFIALDYPGAPLAHRPAHQCSAPWPMNR